MDEVEYHMQNTNGIQIHVQHEQTSQMVVRFKFQVNEHIHYIYVQVM